MIVFIDPNNQNQVMALYTGDTTSTAWTDQGFVKCAIPVELQGQIEQYTRDCRLSIVGGVVTGVTSAVNPVQPAGNVVREQLGSLRQKLNDSSLTLTEMNTMLRLERGA